MEKREQNPKTQETKKTGSPKAKIIVGVVLAAAALSGVGATAYGAGFKNGIEAAAKIAPEVAKAAPEAVAEVAESVSEVVSGMF